jgi:hypothetical protein
MAGQFRCMMFYKEARSSLESMDETLAFDTRVFDWTVDYDVALNVDRRVPLGVTDGA